MALGRRDIVSIITKGIVWAVVGLGGLGGAGELRYFFYYYPRDCFGRL